MATFLWLMVGMILLSKSLSANGILYRRYEDERYDPLISASTDVNDDTSDSKTYVSTPRISRCRTFPNEIPNSGSPVSPAYEIRGTYNPYKYSAATYNPSPTSNYNLHRSPYYSSQNDYIYREEDLELTTNPYFSEDELSSYDSTNTYDRTPYYDEGPTYDTMNYSDYAFSTVDNYDYDYNITEGNITMNDTDNDIFESLPEKDYLHGDFPTMMSSAGWIHPFISLILIMSVVSASSKIINKY